MSPRIRRALGPAYPLLIRLKGARIVGDFVALMGAPDYCVARKGNRPQIGVDISQPMGIGAMISHALLLYAHFDEIGVNGHIRSTSRLYSDGGTDVFREFFICPPWPPELAPLSRLASEFLIRIKAPHQIGIDQANSIFSKYFCPNPVLSEAIEQASGGIRRFDLSIHFRGTDKFLESGKISYDRLKHPIVSEVRGIDRPEIFLATDDAGFARTVREWVPNARFHSFDLGHVEAGMPRHFSNLSPQKKALEALANIFAIARADVCVRTSSYFSAISSIANPAMRTVTVNRTLSRSTPWPEKQILELEVSREQHPRAMDR